MENAFWEKRWKEEILTSWRAAAWGLWCGMGRRKVRKPCGGQVPGRLGVESEGERSIGNGLL